MKHRSWAQTRDTISVGIAFEDKSIRLAKFGYHLANKLGKKLRLVHVCEPWIASNYSFPLGYHTTLNDVALAIETSTAEIAAARLREIAENLGTAVQIQTNIISSGQPASSLSADALVSNSLLTLVGFSGKPNWYTPSGWSTALSLLQSSEVPVMVVPEESPIPDLTSPFRLLVADDLADRSQPALDLAFELTRPLANAEVGHAHITGITKENLDAALQTATATSHTAFPDGITADVLFKDIQERLESALDERTKDIRESAASNAKYTRLLRCGDIQEELRGLVEETKPDALMFGRHHTVHRQPFFFGRIPFHQMLSHQCPVIVVPE